MAVNDPLHACTCPCVCLSAWLSPCELSMDASVEGGSMFCGGIVAMVIGVWL